jgi:hypothetical protein
LKLFLNKNNMAWPFKDYDFYGNKYVNIGEIMWYDRVDIFSSNLPTECILCIEAENESYSKYAHPKAHVEASTQACMNAELIAIKDTTENYLDSYTFHYGKQYIKIYKELYKFYKEEYSSIILSRSLHKDDKICDYHIESIQYHLEKKL